MQRMEVDIDIKLRSVRDLVRATLSSPLINHPTWLWTSRWTSWKPRGFSLLRPSARLHIMKSRPLKDVLVDSKFKSSLAGEQKQDFFPEVKSVKLTLEAEGSSASSAASVSKVPGTHFQPSTSGSSSSSSSSSSWSTGSGSKDGSKITITEMGGGGGGGGGGGTRGGWRWGFL
ncbi:fibrinogen alpha chain [Oncorhynchus kisutch]|uniref:fibrinogen alpha chain n=1 Tax=Oncorhynchus kisutch TaxID=8019 RepID=UPI0012DFBB9B|nr:fibrinogen alpha chain [Oncorhynchus kisutch]